MRVGTAFNAAGVNRSAGVLDWGGSDGLIAFGSHHMVVVYKPDTARVLGTLLGHTGQVNCIKWLPPSVCPPGAALLLSGAADGDLRLWAWHGGAETNSLPPWSAVAVLHGHESAVTSLALLQSSPGTLLLASTSADVQIRIWECMYGRAAAPPDEPELQQAETDNNAATRHALALDLATRFGTQAWIQQPPVPVGTRVQHCVALASLPQAGPGWTVMATGGTDSIVRLYVLGPTGDCTAPAAAAAAAAPPTAAAYALNAKQLYSAVFQLQCELKGHENWVRSLALTTVQEEGNGGTSLLLASAAQDRYVRLWRICAAAPGATAGSHATLPSDRAGQDITLRSAIARYAPRPRLVAGGLLLDVSLEALLVGHEDWVLGVAWSSSSSSSSSDGGGGGIGGDSGCDSAMSTTPAGAVSGPTTHIPCRTELTLLSASQDRSMLLWRHDRSSGLWLSDAALGDAGAACLGFFGGAWSPDGHAVIAHGYTGALHLWRRVGTGAGACYQPAQALGGHCGPVVDLAWGGDGGCLQSASGDQTARLFTCSGGHWCELARTQVHGHDMSCLAAIPTPSLPAAVAAVADGAADKPIPARCTAPCLLYVSGSEEKVLRVFEAPQAFLDSLAAVRARGGGGQAAAAVAALAAPTPTAGAPRAVGASVSALGLSNKALHAGDGPAAMMASGGAGASSRGVGADAYAEGPDFVPCAAPRAVDGPPLEEHLAQNTLWPEIRKLYGHGNDVIAVAAAPDGSLLASACRAQSSASAGVHLWEVGSWRAAGVLPSHALTVTQLEFSPCGEMLLSGSRDRSFSLWRRQPVDNDVHGAPRDDDTSTGGFELLLRHKAAHGRIIWSVSWAHDSRLFATGSRDQTVKLWALREPGSLPAHAATMGPFACGVTAVAFSPRHVCDAADSTGLGPNARLLAVGLEDGSLEVWTLCWKPCGQVQPTRAWAAPAWQALAGSVRRLRWAPPGTGWLCGGEGAEVLLAAGGDDHSVRVLQLTL